jgi:hypothetical protein
MRVKASFITTATEWDKHKSLLSGREYAITTREVDLLSVTFVTDHVSRTKMCQHLHETRAALPQCVFNGAEEVETGGQVRWGESERAETVVAGSFTVLAVTPSSKKKVTRHVQRHGCSISEEKAYKGLKVEIICKTKHYSHLNLVVAGAGADVFRDYEVAFIKKRD